MDASKISNNTVIRGLSIFIGNIKNCSTRAEEEKVVLKTLAGIRNRLVPDSRPQPNQASQRVGGVLNMIPGVNQTPHRGSLTSYDARKYVWQLIYASILGYNVDFGLEVAIRLIHSSRFCEKSTGYIAMGIMLDEQSDPELFKDALQQIKQDLTSCNSVCESLVLSTLGNMGSSFLAEELHPAVINKAFCQDPMTPDTVKKKACMCLVSFMRKKKDIFDPVQWKQGLARLFKSTNYGLLLSACTLLLATIQLFGAQGFEDLLNPLLMILRNVKEYSQGYLYYMTPNPWLQVKILKIFQQFSCPRDPKMRQQILEQVSQIYQSTKITPYVNKNNADHGILFEAINLVLRYGAAVDVQIRSETVKVLVQFIEVKDPNIRYMGLEGLSKLSPIFVQAEPGLMTQHLQVFLSGIKDKDVSVRKRALDVIFSLCNSQVAGEVVNELLDHMQENDYELMEEMVLKVAIIAEKFALNLSWYIDVIIKLIEFGGEYVDDDLWFRVAQMITGFGNADEEPDSTLQKYAAIKMFDVMKTPSLHEAMVKIGAFVLSEFGYLIHNEPAKSLQEQFELIEGKFFSCSANGKAQLLTAFMKMSRHGEQIVKQKAKVIFEQHSDHWNVEIQQRACEYLQMLEHANQDEALIQGALQQMPNFSTEIQTNNVLTKRIMALKIKDAQKLNANVADLQSQVMDDMKRYTQDPSQIQAAVADLVDFGSSNTQQSQAPQNLPNDLDLLSGTVPQQDLVQATSPIDLFEMPVQTSLKFKDQHPESFAKQVTVQPPTSNLIRSGSLCDNETQWKGLLPNSSNQVLFENDQMAVYIQSQVLKYLIRCQLIFKCKTGGQLQDLAVAIVDQELTEKSLQILVSPVMYKAGEDPQVVITAMVRASSLICPTIRVTFAGSSNLDLRLPLYVTKVIEEVNMDDAAFDNNWLQMTSVQPDTFQKLDVILDNPAPSHVPISAVLTQISNFVKSTLSMKVLTSQTRVRAVGQAQFAPAMQTSFPPGPSEMLPGEHFPTMIEAEFYSEDTSQFRLSIRAPPPRSPNRIDGDIAVAILNVLKLFMLPNQN